MNVWNNVFYISIITTAGVLSAMGLWFTAVMPGIDRWNKRFFRYYYLVIMACCLSAVFDFIFFYNNYPKAAVFIALVLESLLLSVPLPMLTVYLLHSASEGMLESRFLRAAFALWFVYAALLISAPFIGIFTYSAEKNCYLRGPLYPLLILPLIVILLLNLAGAIRHRVRLPRKVFLGFALALAPMSAALIANLFVDALPVFDICFILSALIMYSFVLSDQIERDLRHQREIANQRARIMVLQMRPHFIYNTMTSIYCLCKQNPDLAQEVTLNFITYLRRNFTAIASDEPIPFTMELEHTRAYLAVEQAQYEDSLMIDYDTPHTMFRVPPLTLQPLVKNAVKHGRDPYAGPLHISIRTRKTDSGSEITVSDDGRGFQPTDDGQPHTALDNIQERIEMMCGGRITITPNEGGGTRVTVTIPDAPAA